MTPQSLHLTYQRETGMQLSMTLSRLDAWTLFAQRFTEADLICVLRYLKRGIAAQDRRPGCLKISNLLFDLDVFEEELALCRATQRNAKPPLTPKERAVAQLRPTATSTASSGTARPVGELIHNLKQAAGMEP